MPPDSTNLLQQISHLDQTFIYQLIILITAIVGAITGVISVTRKSRSKQNQKRITSTLEQKFSYSYFPQYATEAATAYYIKPNCSTHDPAQVKEEDIRWLLRQSLFEVIDNFLKSNPKYRHLYILGDSGIGKSSFVLNYFVRNYQRAEKDQCHLIIMPLADPELENWIESIADQENTVLFLDGFDEDTKAIDDPTRRFADLIKLCKRFDRLLITSRSQFFPNDEAIQRETHIRRYVPGAGESSDWEFEIRYLLPFSDQQARDFLRHHYPIWLFFRRRRAFRLMKQIPALSMRPMLLYHIPDLINRKQTIRFTFELYEEMIKAWFIREKRWVDPEALREFSEQLAVEIYSKREERQAEWIHYSELLPLAQNWNIDLQTWKLRSRSLLNRSDPQGNYKFAHRSIMEYLFVKRLLDGAFKYSSLQRTDQMNIFLYEMLKSRHSTISQND
ncbi:hypothetical protein HUU05_16640, partial [candidate division KSB1 bacterium]|nr:hypothetical protein [candidate division KSB1 bacterium]